MQSDENLTPIEIKSQTCEEGRGIPQNFCLAFIDELQKQLLKKLLKLANKNVRILIFAKLYFFKK